MNNGDTDEFDEFSDADSDDDEDSNNGSSSSSSSKKVKNRSNNNNGEYNNNNYTDNNSKGLRMLVTDMDGQDDYTLNKTGLKGRIMESLKEMLDEMKTSRKVRYIYMHLYSIVIV